MAKEAVESLSIPLDGNDLMKSPARVINTHNKEAGLLEEVL